MLGKTFAIEALAWFVVAVALTYLVYDLWKDVRLILTKKALMGINADPHKDARITRFAFWANKKGISQLFFLE